MFYLPGYFELLVREGTRYNRETMLAQTEDHVASSSTSQKPVWATAKIVAECFIVKYNIQMNSVPVRV